MDLGHMGPMGPMGAMGSMRPMGPIAMDYELPSLGFQRGPKSNKVTTTVASKFMARSGLHTQYSCPSLRRTAKARAKKAHLKPQ